MNGREGLRRAGTVIASVGVTVGLVCLFRLAVRQLVGDLGNSAVVESRVVEPDIRVPASEFVLRTMVPKALYENYAGLEFNRTETVLHMPFDLAERIHKNSAVAEGWKPLDHPYASKLARELAGQYHYEVPGGDFVIRNFYPIDEANTRLVDIRIPRPEAGAATQDLTFTEIATAHSAETRRLLPKEISEVAVGEVVHTQLLLRGKGAAFYLTAYGRLAPAAHSDLIAARLLGSGWRLESRLNGAYVKSNLSVRYHTDPGEGGVGSMAVYRFTDDEAVVGEETGGDAG